MFRQQFRRGLIEDSGRFCRHFAEKLIECLTTSMLNISPLSLQRLYLPFLFLLRPLFCLGGRLTLLLLNKFGIGVVLANGLEQKTRTVFDLAGGLAALEQVDFLADILELFLNKKGPSSTVPHRYQ